MFLAVPSIALALGMPDGIVWCAKAPLVNLADCGESVPAGDEPAVGFTLHDGCLGTPLEKGQEADSGSSCVGVTLVDGWSRVPVVRECEVMIESSRHRVRVRTSAVGGVVALPSWADQVLVSCPGFADAVLSGTAAEDLVLARGRDVQVTTLWEPGHDGDGNRQSDGLLEVRAVRGKFSVEQSFQPGQTVRLGSIPTGTYAVTLSCRGAATIVDSFDVTVGDEPLQMVYRMVPGYCLKVPVNCIDRSGGTKVDYELYALGETGTRRPYQYGVGTVELQAKGENRWQGEICDLPRGRFELTLSSRRHQRVSRVVEISGADEVHVPGKLDLVPGVGSWVDVIADDGTPVSDVHLVMSWSTEGGRHQETAESSTDERGHAELPYLRPNMKFNLLAGHSAFLPKSVEGLAGDRLLIVLEPKGAITAKLMGEVCDDEPPDVLVELEPIEVEDSHKAPHSLRPESCLVEMPIDHPGFYRLEVVGPDVVPYRREVEIGRDLRLDLGEIVLKPGSLFEVHVVHGEYPVSGAAVRLSRNGTSKLTDESGVAEFAVLDEETRSVSVFVSHPDYAPRKAEYDLDQSESVVIEVFKGGKIRGRVVAEDGRPVVGETVFASGWDQLSTTVDGNGTYEFSRLQPGRWRISRLRMIGERVAGMIMSTGDSRYVSISDGEVAEVNFIPEISVRGRVMIGDKLSAETTIGAVSSSGSAESGSSLIKVPVNEFGEYAVRLPEPGIWVFWYGNMTYSAEVVNCPCIFDLYFVQ